MQILEGGFSNPNEGHVRPDDKSDAALYYERGQTNNIWLWQVKILTWLQYVPSGGSGGSGGAQTPWEQAIDGDGNTLSDAVLVGAIAAAGGLTTAEALRLTDGAAATAGIFVSDEGFGPGVAAPIGSVGIYPTDGAYLKVGAAATDWGKIKTEPVAGTVKVYRALLTQSGTAAPVATVLENTLGGTVVWTRTFAGRYSATLAGAFPADKTWPLCPPNCVADENVFIGLSFVRFSDDVLKLRVSSDGADSSDDVLLNHPVEILVYP